MPTCRADPILGAKVNVLGTLAVFEAVRLAGEPGEAARLRQLRGGVRPAGEVPRRPAGRRREADARRRTTATSSVQRGERRVYFQDYGLSSIGLRPWTVYGVGRDLGMTSEPTKAIKAVALGRPYHISYGGWQDLQYVDDVAKAFVRCLEAPYQGAKSYNLRGAVVDLPTFHKALCTSSRRPASWSRSATGRSPSPTTWTTTALLQGPRPDAEDAAGGRHPADAGAVPASWRRRGGSTRRTWRPRQRRRRRPRGTSRENHRPLLARVRREDIDDWLEHDLRATTRSRRAQAELHFLTSWLNSSNGCGGPPPGAMRDARTVIRRRTGGITTRTFGSGLPFARDRSRWFGLFGERDATDHGRAGSRLHRRPSESDDLLRRDGVIQVGHPPGVLRLLLRSTGAGDSVDRSDPEQIADGIGRRVSAKRMVGSPALSAMTHFASSYRNSPWSLRRELLERFDKIRAVVVIFAPRALSPTIAGSRVGRRSLHIPQLRLLPLLLSPRLPWLRRRLRLRDFGSRFGPPPRPAGSSSGSRSPLPPCRERKSSLIGTSGNGNWSRKCLSR